MPPRWPWTLTCTPEPPVAPPPLPHSQVNPPLHLSQKLDLATAGISSIIPMPLIMPSLDRKESASLYLQVLPLPIRRPLAPPRGWLLLPHCPSAVPSCLLGLAPAPTPPTSFSPKRSVSLVSREPQFQEETV